MCLAELHFAVTQLVSIEDLRECIGAVLPYSQQTLSSASTDELMPPSHPDVSVIELLPTLFSALTAQPMNSSTDSQNKLTTGAEPLYLIKEAIDKLLGYQWPPYQFLHITKVCSALSLNGQQVLELQKRLFDIAKEGWILSRLSGTWSLRCSVVNVVHASPNNWSP